MMLEKFKCASLKTCPTSKTMGVMRIQIVDHLCPKSNAELSVAFLSMTKKVLTRWEAKSAAFHMYSRSPRMLSRN